MNASESLSIMIGVYTKWWHLPETKINHVLKDDNDYSNKFQHVSNVHIKYHSLPLSSKNYCCKNNNKHSTVWKCLCIPALVIWHGQRVRRIMSPVASLVLQGADKSLARPTSPSILFDSENISFDASLII